MLPANEHRPITEILREIDEIQTRMEERLELMKPRPRPDLRLVVDNEQTASDADRAR